MKDFKKVKSISEWYAKLMRDNFPSSFENEEMNTILCDIVFDDEKSIFVNTLKSENKLSQFKDFVYSIVWNNTIEDNKIYTKSVKELLSDVWYNFFYCISENDVNQFK